MMSKIRISAIIFLTIILELSFFPALFSGYIFPDIALVFIILWSSHKKFEEIWLWAFFTGLILDLVISEKIGINALSFLMIVFGTSFLRERFFISQRSSAFFIALIMVAGGTALHLLFVNFLADLSIIFSLKFFIIKICSNIIIAIFLYFILAKFKIIFGINENKLIIR